MEFKDLRVQTPKGAKFYMPEEAARKRFVEEKLLNVFRRWGFQEIITPSYDYFDVLSIATDEKMKERMFKFVDRDTGRMISLRADITPQIAYIAATRLKEHPLPLRLCYITNIFRHEEPKLARAREFFQAGVELIGLEKPEADAEMIAMATEGFREIGLESYQINVGQVDFFRGILEEFNPDLEKSKELQAALHKKDLSELQRITDTLRLGKKIKGLILELPSLFGKEEIFARVREKISNRRSLKALENLEEVFRILRIYGLSDHIVLDLGEIRGFEYYTGIMFEGFVPGVGMELCGGGRYDNLLEKFGNPCPATGFAFDVGRLLLALQHRPSLKIRKGPDFYIIDFRKDKTLALSIARKLRELSFSVARDIIIRELEGSISYAREIEARKVLVLGSNKCKSEEALMIDLQNNNEKIIPVALIMADPLEVLNISKS